MATKSRQTESSPPVVNAKWLAFHHLGSVVTVHGRDITLTRKISGLPDFYTGVLTSLRMNKNEIVLILDIPGGRFSQSRVIAAELS